MQPAAGSQVCPVAHRDELGTCEQAPPAHESTVQPTPSLQSPASQQVPHVAELPAAQHSWPAPQSGAVAHVPALQVFLVHGSPSSHCESLQQAAQPMSGQQSVPLGQPSW
jgi:hypothetical protein